jgi:hypothetical protein
MTRQKHLKERARARMSKTGESYTAARRRVVAARPGAEDDTSGYISAEAPTRTHLPWRTPSRTQA